MKYHVPDEATLIKCKLLASKLKRKHPGWKHDKLARKVAEQMKLKVK